MGLHGAAEGLVRIAELAEGLSGRALRKLPFQAHAFYVQVRAYTTMTSCVRLLRLMLPPRRFSLKLLRVNLVNDTRVPVALMCGLN